MVQSTVCLPAIKQIPRPIGIPYQLNLKNYNLLSMMLTHIKILNHFGLCFVINSLVLLISIFHPETAGNVVIFPG